MLEGERLLNDSGVAFSRLTSCLPVVSDVICNPSTLLNSDAAARIPLVEVFPEIAVVAVNKPSILDPLARYHLSGVLFQDAVRRTARVDGGLELLTQAETRNPGWIAEPGTLARLADEAWTQLQAQHSRMMRALTATTEAGFVDTTLNVLSKIAEGPFRRYGSVYSLASRVKDGYPIVLSEESLFQHRKLGFVITSLTTCAPTIVQGVSKLLRNAEAHYDYKITPSRVVIRHLPPNARSAMDAEVDFLTHDDIVEQVCNLSESALVMAEALMIFAVKRSRPSIRRALLSTWV